MPHITFLFTIFLYYLLFILGIIFAFVGFVCSGITPLGAGDQAQVGCMQGKQAPSPWAIYPA